MSILENKLKVLARLKLDCLLVIFILTDFCKLILIFFISSSELSWCMRYSSSFFSKLILSCATWILHKSSLSVQDSYSSGTSSLPYTSRLAFLNLKLHVTLLTTRFILFYHQILEDTLVFAFVLIASCRPVHWKTWINKLSLVMSEYTKQTRDFCWN